MFLHLNALMFASEWFIAHPDYDALFELYMRVTAPGYSLESLAKPGDLQALFERPAIAAEGMDSQRIGHFVADGMLAPRLSKLEQSCGGVDTHAAIGKIGELLKAGAKGIMFHVNSPGGVGARLPELASYIAKLPVPTASYTHGVEASAAMWAFSGVGLKGATPSAVLGSIGGFIPFIDKAELLAKNGVRWEPVVSEGATLKTALAGPSLSVAERAHLKAGLDATVQEFKAHVNSTRLRAGAAVNWSVLDSGGSYKAGEAARLGLVDFVGEYSDIYDTLAARAKASS